MDAAAPFARESTARPREALLDAAAAEFWIHGLAGTRIQDILDRATASRTSLYNYFTGKAEIADALVAEHRWQRMVATHAAADVDGPAALERFLAAVAERIEHDVRARALVRIAHELPDPGEDSGLNAWHEYVVAALSGPVAAGAVASDTAAVNVATYLVESLCGVILDPVPGEPLADRVATMWRMVRPALGVMTR